MEPPDVCATANSFFEGAAIGALYTNEVFSLSVPIHGSTVSYVTDFGMNERFGAATVVDSNEVVFPNLEIGILHPATPNP